MKHQTNVLSVKPIEVLHIRSRVGQGVEDDPVRVIDEYYFKDGKLLYRDDTKYLTIEGTIGDIFNAIKVNVDDLPGCTIDFEIRKNCDGNI